MAFPFQFTFKFYSLSFQTLTKGLAASFVVFICVAITDVGGDNVNIVRNFSIASNYNIASRVSIVKYCKEC